MPAPNQFPAGLEWLLLAVAGGAGTVARALLTALAGRLCGGDFPWGTLAVNLLGAAAFGAVVAACRSRGALAPGTEALVLVGLLGGFTTFSSYAFQALELLQQGRPATALAYVVISNLAGLAAVWTGMRLAG